MNTIPSLGFSYVHVTNRFNFTKFFLIALMLFSIGFSAGSIIVDLEPALDISRFSSYNGTATFADFFPIEVNLTVAAINGQGGTCWDYYVNGTCGSETLEFEMTNYSGIWKEVIYPDYIYPEIYFATSEITWYNVPLDITLWRSNYHILKFENEFIMDSNMSFWIEFYTTPGTHPNPQDIQIYLVEREQTITYFQDDWRNKAGVELVGSKSSTDPLHHVHTANSSHHLVALSANSDGTFGTKNLNISDNFWIVIYSNSPNTARGWNLKYHNDTLCDNQNAWYRGSTTGWTTTAQSGCPDMHIHLARRENYIDGINLTVTSINSSDDTLSNYSEFYFAELPNLAPNPSAFLTPGNGTFNGTINISWAPATDPNGDDLTYNLTLRNLDGSLNQKLNFTTTTSYEWDSTLVEDDDYDLMIEVCDQEPLCVNFSHSGIFDNFTLKNIQPYIEIISPLNNTYNTKNILLNITNSSDAVSVEWYNGFTSTWILYNEPIYVSITEENNYILVVRVNDTVGNEKYTNVTFTVTIIPDVPSSEETSPSKTYPTFNYEWDCEKGILEIESERIIEIKIMSLVDYSTQKKNTNSYGIASFVLTKSGAYKIVIPSTDYYYPITEEIILNLCEIEEEIVEETCTTQWKCLEWGPCINGTQTRICYYNQKECIPIEEPVLTQKCTITTPINITETSKNITRDVLFDINVQMLSDSFLDELNFIVTLLNLGVPGEVNVTLNYIIEDSSNNIVYNETEIIPVETQKEFIKNINIEELKPGEYTIKLNLTYVGQIEPAKTENSFKIIEIKSESPFENIIFYTGIGIVFIALAFFWLKILNK